MLKITSQFIFDALENNRTSTEGKFLGDFIFLLIFANVIVAIIETLPSMEQYSAYFLSFEIFSLFIFLIEYFLRISTCHYKEEFSGKFGRLGFMMSPIMLFDAFVLFPAIITLFFPVLFVFDARVLRILRILRIIRINRYSKSLGRIIRIIVKHRKDLISAFFLIFIGVFILSTLMFYTEGKIQPEAFKSIPHSMYWGLITVSTIGYGDITPVTEIGKLLTAIGALLGVAVYTLPSALLGAAFYAEAQSKEAVHVSNLEQEVAMLRKKISKYESANPEISQSKEKENKMGFLRWMKK